MVEQGNSRKASPEIRVRVPPTSSLLAAANAEYMKEILYSFLTMSVILFPSPSSASPFVGDPKTRADMLRCDVVVSKYSKKVYQKGSKTILTMAPRWASCPAQKPVAPPPVAMKTPAQMQLELEALNMSLYGDARGPQTKPYTPTPTIEAPSVPRDTVQAPVARAVVTQPIVPVAPVPIEIAPATQTEIVGSPVAQTEAPHFVGAPYKTADGYAVRFSEPLSLDDAHQQIYRFYCTDAQVNLATSPVEDGAAYVVSTKDGVTISTRPASTIRGVNTSSLDPGQHSCLFRFNLPTGMAESESVSFQI